MFVFLLRFPPSNQKNEEKRGGSGSNNWGSVKDEVRSVYFCMFFSCVQNINRKEGCYFGVKSVAWCPQ